MYLDIETTEELSSLKLSQLFLRRPDLDVQTRVKIAVIGKYFKRHGTITRLSEQYDVSRTFIYSLTYQLSEMVDTWFSTDSLPAEYEKELKEEENLRRLLHYRLDGGISLSKCVTLLKIDKVNNSSFGWCSQTLTQLGNLVPNVVNWKGKVAFASDEIYYDGHSPILVSVDPESGAILSITKEFSLTKEAWEKHWQGLLDQGIIPTLLVRDEGVALKAAQGTTLSQVTFQPDTFHAITHQLYKIEQSLLRQSFQAMDKEYKAAHAVDQFVSESVIDKKTEIWIQREQATLEAMELLELFQWLYHHLRRQFKIVQSNGCVRCRTEAEQEAQLALEFLAELPIDFKKTLKNIEQLMPDLFSFLDRAKLVEEQLKQLVDPHILPFWMAYWQYQRSLINLKKATAKRRLTQRFEWLLNIMEEYQQSKPLDFNAEKAIVFSHLNRIVQSSSMVECANARLRPFINEMKGQISQQTLNLIMFHHNHRKFKRGKRAGKAPIEILSGKPLDKNWIDLLIELNKNKSKQTQ